MDIEITELQSQPAIGINATTTLDRIGETLGTIYPRISRYLEENSIVPAGPPFALYRSFSSDGIEMEGGVPLTEPITGEADIVGSELPGGRTATAWHIGPYDTLRETYAKMRTWMTENGIEPDLPCWEVYWTDPREIKDSAQWKTQIFWRVK